MGSKERPEFCNLGQGLSLLGPNFLLSKMSSGLLSSTGALLSQGLRSFEVQEGCSWVNAEPASWWMAFWRGPFGDLQLCDAWWPGLLGIGWK